MPPAANVLLTEALQVEVGGKFYLLDGHVIMESCAPDLTSWNFVFFFFPSMSKPGKIVWEPVKYKQLLKGGYPLSTIFTKF